MTSTLPGRCRLCSTAATFCSTATATRSTTSSLSGPRHGSTRPAAVVTSRTSHGYTRPPSTPRSYATVAGDPSASSDPSPPPETPAAELPWPKPPRGQAHPTPYQILSTASAEPYSKRRFYELVKLYHPDSGACEKHHHHHTGSSTLRLERYRLVVAAHTILSDPDKRRAYDRFGAGWGRVPTAVGGHAANGTPAGPFSAWRQHPDPDIWNNATWEDWEKFYARRDGIKNQQQSPLYLSNSNFVLCVVLVAMIGASLNLSRAETEGGKVVASRDLVHDRASKELRRVRQLSESRPKEERIQFFLRQREAAMHGIGAETLREEKAAKLLPPQETCLNDDLSTDDPS